MLSVKIMYRFILLINVEVKVGLENIKKRGFLKKSEILFGFICTDLLCMIR